MKILLIKLNVKILDVKVYEAYLVSMNNKDEITGIVAQWGQERPDLDTTGFEVVGRILVLAKRLQKRVEDVLAPLDLGLWAFDVLATLRRHGAPFRLTPTELTRATMLTSGAMTNRLDRLEKAGLVRRERNPDDRRGVHVVLTAEGRVLVDRAVSLRLDEANDAVAGLNDDERTALADGLALLGARLGQEQAPD